MRQLQLCKSQASRNVIPFESENFGELAAGSLVVALRGMCSTEIVAGHVIARSIGDQVLQLGARFLDLAAIEQQRGAQAPGVAVLGTLFQNLVVQLGRRGLFPLRMRTSIIRFW